MPGSSIPSGTTVHLDRNVLAFCLAAAFATALLSGLAPALRASRLDLNEALKERTSASQGGGPKDRLRSAIVVAEIALALVILVGAGLLMKSYDRLSRVESGIQSEGVLTLYLPVPGAKYSEPDQILSLYRRLLDRVREIPGVESAGTINALPLRNWGINGSFVIRGQAPAGQSERPLAERRTVDGDYFRSMGIPVLLGQGYSPGPQEGAPLEVMVNSTFAQKFFPDGAVGQFIGFGQPEEESDWSPIVGVVGDVHGAGLHRQPQAEIYFYRPQTHGWGASSSLVLRAAVDPASLVPQVRNAIREIDPEQAVFDVRVMNQVIRDSMSGRRFNTILLAAFAAIALLLSVVGVYSVVSYAVARRTYEIGVRMAMGAQRTHVLKMVIVGSLTLTVIGIAIGIPSSIGLTSLLESQLYAVKPTEPAVFLAVAVLLVAVGLLACWLPARRAMRVDPLIALRTE